MSTKKVLYFTVGPIPTVAELADISAMQALLAPYNVQIRDGGVAHPSYGANLETADGAAGTIPTAYAGLPVITPPVLGAPLLFKLFPSAPSISHTGPGTVQLEAISTTGTNQADIADVDVTLGAAGTAYVSSDPSKATVSANGLVTAVAAGATVITATYTWTSGKTKVATSAITVT